jgi:hypothetical protein
MKNILCAAILLSVFAATANRVHAANPTLAITNLAAGQSVSNANFTVQGTAKGGSGVTNVFYSLNAGGWSNATPVSGGTSWSAVLTLTPGTNSFSAFAQDSSGHRSTTNKVNFAYVVLTPLTVRTNGAGSISPNYDGVPLQIGEFYSLTATSPVAGFGLQNWQSWTNISSITTNYGSTLKFTMASNLTIVANMGDVTKPVITVTSVVTNSGGVPNNLLISGTTSDNLAVTNVQFLQNNIFLTNTVWSDASTGNNWSNWTAQVSLAAGTNIIYLQATDSSGNRSLTNTVKSFFSAYSTLTVRTNGPGKISPLLDGATLLIGTNYTLTAAGTQSGYGLVTWMDGNSNFLGNAAKLNFVMKTNLVLIANIGDKTAPTLTIKGAYTNSDGVGNHYILWGVAADNIGVSNVFYALNNGTWTNATSTNNWKRWSAPVTLLPGANTFSAYAMDGTSNRSAVATMTVDYNNSAPANINGLAAYGFFNGYNPPAPLFLAFGKGTFSQVALDSNAVSGVGSCLYIPSTSSANALLKLSYTAPPSVANNQPDAQFNLSFYEPKLAYFTNKATAQSGFLNFFTLPTLALTNPAGHTVWSFGNQGEGNSLEFFKKNVYAGQSLNSLATNGGSYAYSQSSRNTSYFKLTATNGTSYLIASFIQTNFGSYYQENYDSAGNSNSAVSGVFLIDQQLAGGNAPDSLAGKKIQISNTDGSFADIFGTNSYSQATLSSNYDNDVGNYTYTRIATNISHVNLTVAEPPNLAGSNSVGWLLFSNTTDGLLLNNDGTFTSFSLLSVTNLAWNSISNFNTLLLSYLGDGTNYGTNYFGFDPSDTLYLREWNFFFGWQFQPIGTYTYQVYSPCGAMIHFDYGSHDWVQINFDDTNSGAYFGTSFDANTNSSLPYHGDFQLY